MPDRTADRAEDKLEGIVDLIKMEEWVWKGEDLGASWVRQPIRDELQDVAEEWRGKMIELAVEQDDEAMEAYLDGNEPDEATLRKLIRKGTLSLSFFPVMAGSAFKNKGVQPLLNAVVDFLPARPTFPPIWALRRATRPRPATSSVRPRTTSPSRRWRSRS